jgi:hypothetical protein
MKDLSIRSEFLKQQWEVVENILETIGIGKNFLSRIPMAQ